MPEQVTSPRPISVVLIDDYPSLRTLYRAVLEGQGGFVVAGEADDGLAGVDVVRNARPDIVLLDLSMPTMDGLEALIRIRESSPGSRVVILSGFLRERMEPIAHELGASAYIEKGIRANELVATLLRVASEPPRPQVAVDSKLMERIQALV